MLLSYLLIINSPTPHPSHVLTNTLDCLDSLNYNLNLSKLLGILPDQQLFVNFSVQSNPLINALFRFYVVEINHLGINISIKSFKLTFTIIGKPFIGSTISHTWVIHHPCSCDIYSIKNLPSILMAIYHHFLLTMA